jgi:hypothetical protein
MHVNPNADAKQKFAVAMATLHDDSASSPEDNPVVLRRDRSLRDQYEERSGSRGRALKDATMALSLLWREPRKQNP